MSDYDYIIVGAGSAGCVLAARLSENPALRICLIEAGPKDSNPAIHVPFGLALLSNMRSINWQLSTEPEPALSDRSLYWPRGKTLGGSSSINAMCYIRGNPKNYDHWASRGCEGWDWKSVLPYFLKAEDNSRGASAWHGTGGPQAVSDLKHVNPLTLDFIAAGKALGIPENPDFNGISQEGIGLYQVTQRNGSRCSTATGYLNTQVLSRPNLTVMTDTHVMQILLQGSRARGVKLRTNGELMDICAQQEVILSAGAIGSPTLLMASGIGDPEILAAADIECKHVLSGVGKNLQDHLDFTLLYRQRKSVSYGLSLRRLFKDSVAPFQYWFGRRGMLTSNIAEGAAFFKSDATRELPDIQLHFLPALLVDHGRKHLWGHGFTIHLCHLYPESKGQIDIAKNGEKIIPIIRPNYLSVDADLRAMVNAYRWAAQIAKQPPLSDGSQEFIPGQSFTDDEDIAAYIRAHAETLYHPVGTCKMGANDDPTAVVNHQLRVSGIDGLRVVDASIMPCIVGGNTNAPTIMIAEKAVDMILSN